MIIIIRKRTNQIALYLVNSNKPVTIKELSEAFKVSERTIRYDLDDIDSYLSMNGLFKLIRKPNSGIELDNSLDENVVKMIVNNNEKSYEYVLSSKERLKIILLELLQRKDFIIINDLAEILCVSRSTVINDLKAIKKTLEDNDLYLSSNSNYGLKIEGKEEKIRTLTTQLLVNEADINTVLNSDESIFNSNISKILGDIDLKYIKKCVSSAERSLNLIFSDETFSSIIIYIAMVIRRITLNKNIKMPKEELERVKYAAEFSTASYITKMMEDYFNIEIPIDEIGYIALQFLSGSVTLKEETDNKNYMELEMLANEIIENMNKMINIDLNKDESLFDSLIKHLIPAVFRLRNKLPLKNPLIEQIKSEYWELFKVVNECLAPLENYTNGKLSDDEIGYFTMLFAVALNKVKSHELDSHCKNILIICSTGNSTSELLASKLDAEFDVNIVGKIASHQMEQYMVDKKIDLIISTVPITKTVTNCIIVNPLLKEKDKQLLKGYLKEKSKVHYKENFTASKLQDDKLMESIIKRISKYCSITDYEGLVKEIKDNYIISENTIQKIESQYSLKDLLTENTISLDLIAADWEEAVRKAGELLSENNFTEPRYTEAMIEEIKKIGPYVVIGEGIALPHSRIQNGVKRVGISFIRLMNPVNFGNKDKDPVDLIFAMCTTDKNSHRFALTQLGKLLDDEEMLEVLRNEKNKIKMIGKINKFLDIAEEYI